MRAVLHLCPSSSFYVLAERTKWCPPSIDITLNSACMVPQRRPSLCVWSVGMDIGRDTKHTIWRAHAIELAATSNYKVDCHHFPCFGLIVVTHSSH